jgi:hypothetical protein
MDPTLTIVVMALAQIEVFWSFTYEIAKHAVAGTGYVLIPVPDIPRGGLLFTRTDLRFW